MKKITTFLFGIFCMLSVANAQDITVFDFDGVSPTFSSYSDTFVSAANPLSDAVNSSANAGKYTHSSQWSDLSTTVSIDPRVYTSFEVSVYTPTSTTGTVVIACFDASGKQLDWYSQAITTAGVWTKYTRNLNFTRNIASVVVGFNNGTNPKGTTDDVVYVDNLVFKNSNSTFIPIYSETFYASWSQWGSWKGVPSAEAGNWFGGVDLQTTANDTIRLNRWWNGDSHDDNLQIKSTDADVIITNINVAGFDSLKFSADIERDSTTSELPTVAVKVGTGDWVSVATSAVSKNSWGNQVILLKDAGGNPVNNVSTISLRLSHSSDGSLFYDNVKILGKSIQTGLFNPGYEAFSVYPNPATNYILTQNAQKVSILDLNGRIVKEAINTEKVDISSLVKGAYIVKVKIDNATKIGKFIKE